MSTAATPNPDKRLVKAMVVAPTWWVVRAFAGEYWAKVFQPKGVVAHGAETVPFEPLDCSYSKRQSLMRQALYSPDAIKEVNVFHDEVKPGHAIVTPDDGSRHGWFGLVGKTLSADRNALKGLWIQRDCSWIAEPMPIPEALGKRLRAKQGGTIFKVSALEAQLLRETVLVSHGSS